MRWILGGVAALVTAALVVVGGWDLGWWTATAATKHQLPIINAQNHNFRASYSFQQTLRDELQQELSDIASINVQITEFPASAAALRAQRAAVTTQACGQASQLTGGDIPANVQAFVSTNCQ